MHGTYWPDRTRTGQPASLMPHTTPAASASFVSRTRDLSLQPLRLKALKAYRIYGYHPPKFTSILLFCTGLFPKTIGLPWPLRSGKPLWYVTSKQPESAEHRTDSYGHRRLGSTTPDIQTPTLSYDTALRTPMKWQASSAVRFCLLDRRDKFSDSPSL